MTAVINKRTYVVYEHWDARGHPCLLQMDIDLYMELVDKTRTQEALKMEFLEYATRVYPKKLAASA